VFKIGEKMNNNTKPTLLIVDDDKRVLKSLKLWLSSEEFNVLTASNGHEAIKHVSENPIDVALVDFRISNEDGLNVSEKLVEIDEELKIIILTGFPSYQTAVEAMKIGVFDYLSKSSPNERILETVWKAIKSRENERRIKEKTLSSDSNFIKIVLFCSHSLIKERLENFSINSVDFKLVRSFQAINTVKTKTTLQEVDIGLICANCNLKNFSDAYTIFPELLQAFPSIKLLVFNENFSDKEKIELLKLGIRGFCPQDSGTDILEKAIHHISKGELWVSRRLIQLSFSQIISQQSGQFQKSQFPSTAPNPVHHTPHTHKNNNAGLTGKENVILKKIAQGFKNKEIASQLFISETTVKTHINRILKKLGVDNRTKAIITAMEKKLI